jgi:hypothetical protein
MTIRIAVLAAIAVGFLVAGCSALWVAAGILARFQDPSAPLIDDQQQQASLQAWLNALLSSGSPLIGAGLIAGVAALALIVRRHSERRA